MGVNTVIGLGCLSRDGIGKVDFPEEVTLYCPQCGTKVNDKGDCKASFANVIDEFEAVVLRVLVDCRVCGCDGREPAIFPLKENT